ncbi:carbonic anhydrase [Desulfosporosinus acidiphilus SJ4]|uniref:Carbonic anhydrase n=1 Tax=Desulfosporosinus acidiphilus (strain DSM 22704 / JCM 16185 / SJ4) TaxID=646529 RepID=I4D6C0_DESAJ|nr:carbonic anhydrase [Desulfosporosinus acidiphilus]AFM41344.1 carbonic anhydrase [Desulfosporosinus acidiphilus SJ4]
MKRKSSYIVLVLFNLAILLNGCHQSSLPQPVTPSVDQNSQVQQTSAMPVYQRKEMITSPAEALQLLLNGNQRFKSGKVLNKDFSADKRSDLLQKGQHPFAAIISCSDSRVPPELLFDQALGDLFVIRVAGNVITPAELGSVEYAVDHLKVPLVLVLGHEGCGAVTAAVEGGEAKGSLSAVIDKITPSVHTATSYGLKGNIFLETCVDLNIHNSVLDIQKSPVIKEYLNTKQIQIVGAKYDLDQGKVSILN